MTFAPSISPRRRSIARRRPGCLAVASAAEAADGAEAIVTMLPAGKHVEQVYADSVFGAAPPSRDPDRLLDDRRRYRASASPRPRRPRGSSPVDAPVSGGIAAANAGTLTFMVGGSAEGFERAEPFLSDMGKAVIHAGASGAGQAAKICNNMLLGATMVATCEAFLLAREARASIRRNSSTSARSRRARAGR